MAKSKALTVVPAAKQSLAVGRPSDYTDEKADAICARIAQGESLNSICRDAAMPAVVTVYGWLRKRPEFAKQYAQSREDQADTLADEILEISDDGRNDWMMTHGRDDAGWRANHEQVQRSRLRVDTRKWIAAKLKPKKYGDLLRQEHTGADGQPLPGTAPTFVIAATEVKAIEHKLDEEI